MDFDRKLQVFREQVEKGLRQYVPLDPDTPSRLSEAMLHSLHAGGKRIRPVMLLGIFESNPSQLDPIPAAVAIECLHTYSLIHDDLPSMDDSDLRRGKPTCHVAFDEATAVLAGDALLTLAFEILATEYADHPPLAIKLIKELSNAAGSSKLVGGQMEDILLESANDAKSVGIETVFRIEDNKTGALFCACLRMGLILAGANPNELSIATDLGRSIGRSFQIIDDILDEVGDEATVGKTLNVDHRNQKTTAVSHYGIEGARNKVSELHQQGIGLCEQLSGDLSFVISLLNYLKNRVY